MRMNYVLPPIGVSYLVPYLMQIEELLITIFLAR
ncbi:MAG: hypothetical protein K0R00_2226 [Herbinix sp.]|jgi:hypothetical protein|nr:hypothetical protein [Herbinix sp.]